MNQNNRNPVLLIYGIYNTSARFKAMKKYLTNLGWSVHCLSLKPNNGNAHLETLAQQVDNYVNKNFDPKQPIDLVGFSMGGLVTRYYLQRLGGVEKVQRYINISAPNNGTRTAYLLPNPGIKQMRPNSQFLQELNKDIETTLDKIDVTVIWTPYDLMIFPPSSSKMGIGEEIKLPVLIHRQMVTHHQILKTVSDSLSKPVKI
ncbi:alpha/beta fold hydrolase [Crocosphaera sp.]|uniref:esterase/lipase family protein n=1 Tax=Crocosphaera sp. TaxID=2729996 RepID=UPI00262345E0|nr:alpha/beta fold hydrolase [Crocosphaera sp.]MDJ0581908.1 alpha/beta fold hydrolase [Crocosphaera sp.]